MDPVNNIYHNPQIAKQLKTTVSGSCFTDPSWEFNYFGKDESNSDDQIYVIATYASLGGVDGAGFWAFTVDGDDVQIKNMYFATDESTYWDALAIAKLKYPALKDLVLD